MQTCQHATNSRTPYGTHLHELFARLDQLPLRGAQLHLQRLDAGRCAVGAIVHTAAGIRIQTAAAVVVVFSVALSGVELAPHRVQLLLERLGTTLSVRAHSRTYRE
jgi:hypothetical protein